MSLVNKTLKYLKRYGDSLYRRSITPHSQNEDVARREYIFNILVLGLSALTFLAFVLTLLSYLRQGDGYENVPPFALLIPIAILLSLYKLARKKFRDWIVWIFIGLYLVIATYSMYLYSYVLPQGLLIYVLVIIMSGILISARASLVMTLIVLVSLSILAYIQINGLTDPYADELNEPFKTDDLLVYIVIFAIIFSVSWLSNREIETSLKRARKSEKELRVERNSLEEKVKERTQALEKAQVEKTLELYRFAEFGRISSTLLHELVNPLTAVSLDLEQLETKQKSRLVGQIREGINHMEQYVQSARQQLRSQSEVKLFDTRTEIKRVFSFLTPKAKASQVKLTSSLAGNIELYGDNSKFSQIIANLVGNAIDAYKDSQPQTERIVVTRSLIKDNSLIISVTDHGVGISGKELVHIFEPFFTTKSSDRGTGIGLTITKRIVEEDFKGTIAVHSSKNIGTVFSIDLPIQPKP